jgi:hypothetical protein
MSTRWRYIHISDPHFCVEPVRYNALTLIRRRPRAFIDTGRPRGPGLLSLAKPASYVPDIISGVAQFCFDRRHVSDGILITGDLATTGLATDIRVANAFISEPARSGYVTERQSPTLHPSNLPILIIPGNHDKYIDNQGTPNGRTFELTFPQYLRNCWDGVGHWVRKKNDTTIGLISADFCLLERGDALDKVAGVYGQGRVYEHILDELKRRTLNLRARYRGIYLIWIIHFAPFDCGYGLQLIDFDEIISSARLLNIVATLCGHTHRAAKHQIDNHIIYCAGSAGCVDSEDDSRVHVIQIDIDKECRISRESYWWDAGQHEFTFIRID